MFQFLAKTKAGCRRSFPRHLLHRITTLAISAITALVAQVIYTQPVNADQASRPNIVLLMADDMGYGDPGCYNADSKCRTSAIDRLAREGIRFTDAHSPASWCIPTRYGLLTGRYPLRMKRGRGGPLIAADRLTLGGLLQSKGYQTAMVGKWHLGVEHEKQPADHRLVGGPADRGFHSYFGIPASLDIPPYYYIRNHHAVAPPINSISASNTPGWSPIQGAFWRKGGIAPGFKHIDVLPTLTREAVAFLKSRRKQSSLVPKSDNRGYNPFFLYFALPAPHTPWVPTEKYRGKSQAGSYGDFVMQVDDTVRAILDTLHDEQLERDTIVIFTSDNGPVWYEVDEKKYGHQSTGPFRGMKGDAWEGGHRMPFIVRWPARVKGGRLSNQTICHTDVLATVADVLATELGDKAPEDSYSFYPILQGESGKTKRAFTIHQPSSRLLAIRKGDWKLIPQLGSGGFSKPRNVPPKPNGPTGQLYNLRNDPGETNNLFRKQPAVVADLKSTLELVAGKD